MYPDSRMTLRYNVLQELLKQFLTECSFGTFCLAKPRMRTCMAGINYRARQAATGISPRLLPIVLAAYTRLCFHIVIARTIPPPATQAKARRYAPPTNFVSSGLLFKATSVYFEMERGVSNGIFIWLSEQGSVSEGNGYLIKNVSTIL